MKSKNISKKSSGLKSLTGFCILTELTGTPFFHKEVPSLCRLVCIPQNAAAASLTDGGRMQQLPGQPDGSGPLLGVPQERLQETMGTRKVQEEMRSKFRT